MLGICHLLWTGTMMRLSRESTVAQVDDSELFTLRAYGAPRGVFPVRVDANAVLEDVRRLRKKWDYQGAPICLLNFERCDGWERSAAYLEALVPALLEDDAFSSVYLYGWHGDGFEPEKVVDGRMVPMNTARDVLPRTEGIIPILHPIEHGLNATQDRMRELIAKGHDSCVLWTCTEENAAAFAVDGARMMMHSLAGYWEGVADARADRLREPGPVDVKSA